MDGISSFFVVAMKRELNYLRKEFIIMQGDVIDVFGRNFIWDEILREYGHWVALNGGRRRFLPMTSEDAAQAVGFGVEELIGKPMKLRKHAPKGEIVAEMLQEERRRRIRLKNVGRSFLTDVPFEERETHENEHNLPVLSNSNASVDLKVAGATVKRCFYDADGNILQEIHYLHQDSRGTHLFPHIHIWIEGERSFAIAYRDQDNIVRYRRARKMKKRKAQESSCSRTDCPRF